MCNATPHAGQKASAESRSVVARPEGRGFVGKGWVYVQTRYPEMKILMLHDFNIKYIYMCV